MIVLKLGAKNDFVGIMETVSLWLNVFLVVLGVPSKASMNLEYLAKVPHQLCYAKLLKNLENLVCEISLIFDCLVIQIKLV